MQRNTNKIILAIFSLTKAVGWKKAKLSRQMK
jgi:hypothetical protein